MLINFDFFLFKLHDGKAQFNDTDMESNDIRVCKLQVKKVTQDVQTFIWFKHGVIPENPKPELFFVPDVTAEFLNNLSLLVWIESYRNEYVWEGFLKNHFKRMNTTPYLFTKYFAYASYLLIEKATDVYACFCDVLALINHFAFHCWQKDEKKFIFCCVDLFCEFFNQELCLRFENQGRWKNFNKYIENHGNLKRYKELIGDNEPETEIFKDFQTSRKVSKEPYAINGVVLKDITEFQVENDKRIEIFADSVADKVKETCGKNAFVEVYVSFMKTERQLEEQYRKIAGEASGGMKSAKDGSSLLEVPKEELENISSTTNPEESEDQMKVITSNPCKDPAIDSLKSRDSSPSSQEPCSSFRQVQECALKNTPSKTKPKESDEQMESVITSNASETPVIDSLKSQDLSPESQEHRSSFQQVQEGALNIPPSKIAIENSDKKMESVITSNTSEPPVIVYLKSQDSSSLSQKSHLSPTDMESMDIIVCKLQVKKVTQDVQTFIWFKHGVIPENPKPELFFVPDVTAKFLNNLCLLVWIESYRNEYVWEGFLKNHFKRMKKTPYLFAKYFAYASYLLIEKSTDVYSCFCDILALINHFAFHCWQKDEKKFIFCCVDLFCEFFYQELCLRFENQGRWKNFNKYIENHGNLKRFKQLIGANKPENEIFKEFQTRHQASKEPYSINGVVLKDITEFQVENDKKVEIFADFVADKVKETCGKSAFYEVYVGFMKTERQVEELHRKMVGEAAGGLKSAKDGSSLLEALKEELENFSCTTNPEESEDQMKGVITSSQCKSPAIDSLKSQDSSPASQEPRSSMQQVQDGGLKNTPRKTKLKKSKTKMNSGVTSSASETPAISSLKSQDSSPLLQKSHLSPDSSKREKAKVLLKEMMIDIEKIFELIKYVCDPSTS